MSTTIRDVAQASGVSIATISKYYNGVKVRESSRLAIEAAADELGYIPNLRARGLKTNKSFTIGLMFSKFQTNFASHFYPHLEEALSEHGYNVLLYDFKDDEKLFTNRLNYMIAQNIQGLVIMSDLKLPESLKMTATHNIPVVLIENYLSGFQCDTVLVDSLNSLYDATERLINSGHRKIAILLGPEDSFVSDERSKGYKRAFEDYNLPINPEYISYGEYSISTSYNKTMELMSIPNPPTAILATNHEISLGASMAFMRMNMAIPQDISFVGFDVNEYSHDLFSTLPIIAQPFKEIAMQTVNQLMQRINGDFRLFPNTLRIKAYAANGKGLTT